MDIVLARQLRAFGACVAIAFLAGCAGWAQHPREGVPVGVAQPGIGARAADPGAIPFEMDPRQIKVAPRQITVHGGVGEDIARRLQSRYDETIPNCNHQPAVLCSGILMRVSSRGPGFHIWNPNPTAPIKQGVAFSWLRKDNAFDNPVFGKGSGFIFMPRFLADEVGGFRQLNVLCVFPYDGWTWGRTGGRNDGCDRYGSDANSQPCQAQGITSSQQWVAKFGWQPEGYVQCAFDIRPGTADAYRAFEAQMAIRQGAPNAFAGHNEFMVSAWPQNDPIVPLEAFFYINGSAGRSEAMANQVDFFDAVGRWVPVIQLTMPRGPNGAASFRYLKEDQPIQ